MGIHYPLYAIILDLFLISATLVLLYLFLWKLDISKLQSRGRAAFHAGDLNRAINYFGRIVAAKDTPGREPNPEAKELLSEAYHVMGDAYALQEGGAEQAAKCYLRIKEIGGGLSKPAILTLAQHFAKVGSKDKAVVEVYLAALQLQLIPASDDQPIVHALCSASMIDEKTNEAALDARIHFARKAMQWAPQLAWPPLFAGIGLYRKDQFEESLKLLRLAAELNPADAMVFYWLGMVLQKLAPQDQEGFRALETFLAIETDDKAIQAKKATVAFESAHRLLEPFLEDKESKSLSAAAKQNIRKAQQLLLIVIQLAPYNDHAQFYLGECSRLLGNFKSAAQSYQKAVEIAPEKLPYGLALAQSWYALDELNLAKKSCEQILAVHPKHLEALNLLIKIADRENDFTKLEEYCQGALDAGDEKPAIHALYIASLYNLEKFSLICQLYPNSEKISLHEPSGQEAIFYLARAHALSGKFAEALPLYEKAATSPRNDYFHGCLLAHLDRPDEALALWDKTTKAKSPFQIKALLQCGHLLEKLERDGAEAYYLKALKSEKNNEEALSALGLFYIRIGDLVKAEPLGIRLQKEYPANPHGLWIMAQIYGNHKQFDRAIKVYEQLRDHDLYKDAVLQQIGILYYRTGHIKEAMATLEKLHQSGDADQSMLFYLGLCYARLNRFGDAISLWQVLLGQSPEDQKIKNNLAHVYYRYAEQLTLEQKLTEAIYQLENYIALEPSNEKAKLHLAQLYFQLGLEEIMKGKQSSDAKVNDYMAKSFSYRPDHQLSAFYLALSDLYKHNYADALLKFTELGSKNPKDRRIQYYYALTQYFAGKKTTGQALLKKLMKQDSMDIYGQKIALFLANEHIHEGQYQKAVQLLENTI